MINLPAFKNESYRDFSSAPNAAAMNRAIARVGAELNREYTLIIGGERVTTGDLLESVNPAEYSQVVGRVHRATPELADRAIRVAASTFESWKKVSAEERAGYLFKAAAEMRRHKDDFNAWMVFEVGKSWAEAEADTAEAIDFMDFYARQALRYAGPQPLTPSPLPDEVNEMTWIPLGVGVVIPPWNFPLAIMAGMTTAALVTGNTVVLKPSSDSPVIAAKFVELLERIGLPPGVVNFLPASGSQIGDLLVAHPLTRFISFTGSMEVGLRINQLAATPSPGQIWIKRGQSSSTLSMTKCSDWWSRRRDRSRWQMFAAMAISPARSSAKRLSSRSRVTLRSDGLRGDYCWVVTLIHSPIVASSFR